MRQPRTANHVLLTDGMTVWDSNLDRVTVDLSRSFEENGEIWFYATKTTGGRREMVSESRTTTRHPFTGEQA